MTDSPQRSFPGPSFTQRANQISKRASKQRRTRLPVLHPALIADATFNPVEGVPATRADCPKGYCPHVRCRLHLALETGDHRAGRPGLSQVKRDSRGLTLSQPGDAGDERPGTTLRPTWMRVRGLDVEREVKVAVQRDETGYTLHEVRFGTLDYWLARLHIGERVGVFCDEDETPAVIAMAELTPERTIKFDRDLPDRMVGTTANIILARSRQVSSCALDLIDQHGKLTNEQTGDAVGRHRTLVAREVRRALGKAIEAAEEMGMTKGDLMRGLGMIGADR